MSKDPAFLFYYQDFFTGVSDMTNEEVGAYIRCLCIQASKGGITEKHMKNICFESDIHEYIKPKFVFNEETKLFENIRLKDEINKRQKYSESRSNNRKTKVKTDDSINNTSKTYVQHMENENENENEDINEKENATENKKTQKSKKEISKVKVIVYPFETENFISQWLSWKNYKSKEFKFNYKSSESEQAGLMQLMKLSGNNEIKAVAIIHQSMSNGWKGFFELKNITNGQQQQTNAEIFSTAMQSEAAKNFRYQ